MPTNAEPAHRLGSSNTEQVTVSCRPAVADRQ